ncbi:unnamed protein product [Cuscuta epithymum]|uniref:Uncharacterized protein n=1 Tax=Cuscuta epithymum TaxID=186058 RepID=A0AAV0EUY3_9ASTE|nr:unnamed protein product [Cuscuta epithymum]
MSCRSKSDITPNIMAVPSSDLLASADIRIERFSSTTFSNNLKNLARSTLGLSTSFKSELKLSLSCVLRIPIVWQHRCNRRETGETKWRRNGRGKVALNKERGRNWRKPKL